MKLSETVEMMNSNDYKERFKAEYYQLKERYERLNTFNNRIEVAERMLYVHGKDIEMPKHDCTLELLQRQQCIMGNIYMFLNFGLLLKKLNCKGGRICKCSTRV